MTNTTKLLAGQIAKIREGQTSRRWGASPFIGNILSDVDRLLVHITALEAELQEARRWQANVEEREAATCPEDVAFDDYIRHLEKQNKSKHLTCINEWRSQLVAAVRAITMTVQPTAERDGYFRTPLQVRDEAVRLIQSFNPAPDDVAAQLASPVHEKELGRLLDKESRTTNHRY